MSPLEQDHNKREAQERERILARYFNVDSIKGDNRQLVREFLSGAVWSAILTLLLFYLKFRTIGWFAIGFTIFLVALCFLFALGFYFQTRAEYHTAVQLQGGLGDRIGAFWLVACAFGPFIGWLITVFSMTVSSWRWQYMARVFVAVVVPVLTAMPLVRYAKGTATLIAIPLLLGITALPVLSCWWVIGDLHDGLIVSNIAVSRDREPDKLICKTIEEQVRNIPCDISESLHAGDEYQIAWLPHTKRVLEVRKL